MRLIGAVVCLSCCTVGPLVCYRGQWMTAYRAEVPLAHAVSCHFQDCKALLFTSLLMYAALYQVSRHLPLMVAATAACTAWLQCIGYLTVLCTPVATSSGGLRSAITSNLVVPCCRLSTYGTRAYTASLELNTRLSDITV